SAFSCGDLGFARRPDPIRPDPEADHRETGFRIQQRTCGSGDMNALWTDAQFFQNLHSLMESAKLELCERWVERVFDIGNIGGDTLNYQAGQITKGASEILEFVNGN